MLIVQLLSGRDTLELVCIYLITESANEGMRILKVYEGESEDLNRCHMVIFLSIMAVKETTDAPKNC